MRPGPPGLDLADVAARSGVSALRLRRVARHGAQRARGVQRDGRFTLSRIGHFLLHDGMTRANMDFTAEVCWRPLAHLSQAIRDGTPAGLGQEFGRWPTIYQGLSQLPEPARRAWFAFDHYYSDRAFGELLPRVFAGKPRRIVDIGANTARFALRCCAHDADAHC
jgi:hypothetical protein